MASRRPAPPGEPSAAATVADVAEPSSRERLQRAAERLFARDGIHRVTLREINQLAGQRNRSALHYHFGSRDGLVIAILQSHQKAMDEVLIPALDELEARPELPTVHEIVETTLRPLGARLESESGRDFVRILPQVLDTVSANLRAGMPPPASDQPARSLRLVDRNLEHLRPELRRERLVAYVLLMTSLMAERAHHLESGAVPTLSHEDFIQHAVVVLSAVIQAPSPGALDRRLKD